MQGRELTDRQRQILEVIRESLRTRGVAPSHTEIAEALGLAGASSVEGHLRRLAAKGWIEVIPSIERGIRLLREGLPIVDSTHLPRRRGRQSKRSRGVPQPAAPEHSGICRRTLRVETRLLRPRGRGFARQDRIRER